MGQRILAGLILALACALAAPSGLSFAQSAPEPTSPVSAIDTLILSYDLAEFGTVEEDAEALILAARLYQSITISDADFGGTVSIASARDDHERPDNPALAYLDAAEVYAGNNAYLLLQIDALRAQQPKEVLASDYATGPLMHGRWLRPGAAWEFEILVSDREPVSLAAIGDGDAVIGLEVIGERGEQTVLVPPHDSRAVAQWQPEYESRFAVSVFNHGSVESYVAVYSN